MTVREKEKKLSVKYNGLHALATLERATMMTIKIIRDIIIVVVVISNTG